MFVVFLLVCVCVCVCVLARGVPVCLFVCVCVCVRARGVRRSFPVRSRVLAACRPAGKTIPTAERTELGQTVRVTKSASANRRAERPLGASDSEAGADSAESGACGVSDQWDGRPRSRDLLCYASAFWPSDITRAPASPARGSRRPVVLGNIRPDRRPVPSRGGLEEPPRRGAEPPLSLRGPGGRVYCTS